MFLSLAVAPGCEADSGFAAIIAEKLRVPCLDDFGNPHCLYEFLLLADSHGLQLQWLAQRQSLPLRVDFGKGSLSFRRHHGGGVHEPLARAVGIRGGKRPAILDATAGIGRDGFILASLGCPVLMVERHPVAGLLLEDGLKRARHDPELHAIVNGIRLHLGDCRTLVLQDLIPRPEVIYLDPMYPHRVKSALVKKEMRILRRLAGDDADADRLLCWALATGVARVVVKRPLGAVPLDGRQPSGTIKTKNHRYDIYT